MHFIILCIIHNKHNTKYATQINSKKFDRMLMCHFDMCRLTLERFVAVNAIPIK